MNYQNAAKSSNWDFLELYIILELLVLETWEISRQGMKCVCHINWECLSQCQETFYSMSQVTQHNCQCEISASLKTWNSALVVTTQKRSNDVTALIFILESCFKPRAVSFAPDCNTSNLIAKLSLYTVYTSCFLLRLALGRIICNCSCSCALSDSSSVLHFHNAYFLEISTCIELPTCALHLPADT